MQLTQIKYIELVKILIKFSVANGMWIVLNKFVKFVADICFGKYRLKLYLHLKIDSFI